MRKRIGIALLFVVSLLGSCSLSVRQYNPLDENNYSYNLGDRTDYRALSANLVTLPLGYSLVDYDSEKCERGYLEIQSDSTGYKGFVSLFNGQIIVPCRYESFSYSEDANNGTYIFAKKSDGSHDIYDYKGYLVDSNVTDNSYEVSTSVVVLDYQQEHLVEMAVQNGTPRQREILSDRSRVSFVTPCDLLLKSKKGFVPLSSDLSNIALSDYVGTITSGGRFTVTKNGKVVSEFQIPLDASAMTFYWKSFIYQTKTLTTGTDYTYEDGGVRYVVKTFRVQLADGKKSELICPYLLSPIRPIYDDLGQAKWLLATVFPINDKKIAPSRRYVFNNDAEVVFNTANNPAYSDDVLLLKWNAIYSSDGAVMDRYFQKIATLPYPVTEISYPTSSFVSFENGRYGVTDYQGDQVIPNEYEYIHLSHPYNNCGFGTKSSGLYYSINPVVGTSKALSLMANESLDDLGLGVCRVSSLQNDGSYFVHYLYYDLSYMSHYFWRLPDSSCTLTTFYDQLVVDAYHDSEYAWQSFSLR